MKGKVLAIVLFSFFATAGCAMQGAKTTADARSGYSAKGLNGPLPPYDKQPKCQNDCHVDVIVSSDSNGGCNIETPNPVHVKKNKKIVFNLVAQSGTAVFPASNPIVIDNNDDGGGEQFFVCSKVSGIKWECERKNVNGKAESNAFSYTIWAIWNSNDESKPPSCKVDPLIVSRD